MATPDRKKILDLVVAIVKDEKDRDLGRDKFSKLLDDPDLSSLRYNVCGWVFNMFYKEALRTLDGPADIEEIRQKERTRAERARAFDEEVQIVKGTIVGNLLNHMTMIGKPLRDCTGKDCTILGGFFSQIGKTIKPDDVVGEMLSEHDLRTLAMKMWPDLKSSGKPSSEKTSGTSQAPNAIL